MYYKGYEITIRRGFYVAIDLQGIARFIESNKSRLFEAIDSHNATF